MYDRAVTQDGRARDRAAPPPATPRTPVEVLGSLAGNRAVASLLVQRECGDRDVMVKRPNHATVIDRILPLLQANVLKLANEAYAAGYKPPQHYVADDETDEMKLVTTAASQSASGSLSSRQTGSWVEGCVDDNKHAEPTLIDTGFHGSVLVISQPCCVVCAALCRVFGIQIPKWAPTQKKSYNYVLPDALFADRNVLYRFLGPDATKRWQHVEETKLDEHLKKLFSSQKIYNGMPLPTKPT